jgi:hypothetical protein
MRLQNSIDIHFKLIYHSPIIIDSNETQGMKKLYAGMHYSSEQFSFANEPYVKHFPSEIIIYCWDKPPKYINIADKYKLKIHFTALTLNSCALFGYSYLYYQTLMLAKYCCKVELIRPSHNDLQI